MWVLQLFSINGQAYGEVNCIAMAKTLRELESDDDEIEFELSVVQEDSHGTRSWGWPGENKITVLFNGVGGGGYSIDTLEKIIPFAATITERFNGTHE